MAATKQNRRDQAGAVIAAALALPGVIAPLTAHAETAPEAGLIALKYLHYKDSQPGLDRITVKSPSLYVLAPLSPQWAIEGSLVSDAVSGATPRYHTAISGATRNQSDNRTAGDIKVTRYFDRASYSLGFSKSSENDYDSDAVSLGASFASEDNNTTWNVGAGYASDKIGSTINPTLDEKKRTTELMFGVTQAVTANDLVQLNVTFNKGRGYYTDPYKVPDTRPRKRDQQIFLLRWNHHLADQGATVRTSYRYYHDDFGIDAHTLAAEWVQRVGPTLTITPSTRFYSQSAANFYYDPVYDREFGAPFPPGFFTNRPQFLSADQRLSAFGGITVGIKAALQITPDWTVDAKAERYEQRGSWRIGGSGSPGLAPFRATFLQLGVSKRF